LCEKQRARIGLLARTQREVAGVMESHGRTEWTVVMFLGLALMGGVGALARSGVRIRSWR